MYYFLRNYRMNAKIHRFSIRLYVLRRITLAQLPSFTFMALYPRRLWHCLVCAQCEQLLQFLLLWWCTGNLGWTTWVLHVCIFAIMSSGNCTASHRITLARYNTVWLHSCSSVFPAYIMLLQVQHNAHIHFHSVETCCEW